MDRRDNRPDDAGRRLMATLAATPRNLPALLMLAGLEAEAGKRAEAIARVSDHSGNRREESRRLEQPGVHSGAGEPG